MQGIQTLGIAVASLIIVSACDMETEQGETLPGAETTTEQPDLVPAPPTGSESGAAMLRIDSLAGAGAYITDASGRALYLLEGEPSDRSTCTDACAEAWPPLLAGGTPPQPAAGLSGEIGTIERQDGSMQVTYAGHPLYYYHDDQGPGDTTGQDVTDQWGEWYLVTPSGEPLEGEGTAESSGG